MYREVTVLQTMGHKRVWHHSERLNWTENLLLLTENRLAQRTGVELAIHAVLQGVPPNPGWNPGLHDRYTLPVQPPGGAQQYWSGYLVPPGNPQTQELNRGLLKMQAVSLPAEPSLVEALSDLSNLKEFILESWFLGLRMDHERGASLVG